MVSFTGSMQIFSLQQPSGVLLGAWYWLISLLHIMTSVTNYGRALDKLYFDIILLFRTIVVLFCFLFKTSNSYIRLDV